MASNPDANYFARVTRRGIEYAVQMYGHPADLRTRGGTPLARAFVRLDDRPLPFSESHRLTDVIKVRLEAGEYIVPAYLVPKLRPIPPDA